MAEHSRRVVWLLIVQLLAKPTIVSHLPEPQAVCELVPCMAVHVFTLATISLPAIATAFFIW